LYSFSFEKSGALKKKVFPNLLEDYSFLIKTKGFKNLYGKSWPVGNASKNETNEILTIYSVKGSALYTEDSDQDDL